MNNKIKELNKKLSSNLIENDSIHEQLQVEWDKVFKDLAYLKEAVANLEASNDYAWDTYGEIIQWSRFSAFKFKDCKEFLTTYMRENHYAEIDWQNDSISMSVGHCIVINDSGDVYDQDGNNFFIKKSDYTDEEGKSDESKRNELIEAYMEKTGCYPGVFKSDYYGDIVSVNTKVG